MEKLEVAVELNNDSKTDKSSSIDRRNYGINSISSDFKVYKGVEVVERGRLSGGTSVKYWM